MTKSHFFFFGITAFSLVFFSLGYYIGNDRASSIDFFIDQAYVFDSCFMTCLNCNNLNKVEFNKSKKEEKESEEPELSHEHSEEASSELFYAQLAGFSLYKEAVRYVERLKKRGISSQIKTYRYKNHRLLSREWYQVITDPLGKEELEGLVRDIANTDHLQDCAICKYDK